MEKDFITRNHKMFDRILQTNSIKDVKEAALSAGIPEHRVYHGRRTGKTYFGEMMAMLEKLGYTVTIERTETDKIQ